MLKATALYLVIVIALVIAVLCSSLIAVAYFYRSESQISSRYIRLERNLNSGINILLAGPDSAYSRSRTFSLFGDHADSVALQQMDWGIYEIGTVKAFTQTDTLYRAFSLANTIDSSKWAALYLADRDRPLSLSGETSIVGNAFVPKAGVKKAYINNKAYHGDEKLVQGKITNSAKKLPPLNETRVALLQGYLSEKDPDTTSGRILASADTIQNSFLKPTRSIHLGRKVQTIKNIVLRGNIILFSDTALTIEPSALLENVLIFARSITVNSGFRGTCQLFATDAIHIQAGCVFNYPSCLGVLNSNSSKTSPYVKITLDKNSVFNGAIFIHRQKAEEIIPVLALDSNVTVRGQIYSEGMLQFKSDLRVNGSVFTRLFTYQSGYNLMENTLIDAKINAKALSPYYLTSVLFPVSKRKKVLQWLEQN
jgi:hypothetical protein